MVATERDRVTTEDKTRTTLPAIIVKQWLPEWDEILWDKVVKGSEPAKKHFYVTSISARKLRQLSGLQPRKADSTTPRMQHLAYQRSHDSERSKNISRFVMDGFPWSDLSKPKRESGEYDDLKKPGWLPTGIIVNAIQPRERRGSGTLKPEHAVTIIDGSNGLSELSLPDPELLTEDDLPPLEIIDGQHRLKAFGDELDDSSYELPVVLFDGLDRHWQAYLFWTINIKPKRINASLGFDLYPLLRMADWLERFAGHSIYRETRAQELTETLWFYPESPWRSRINMLGESRKTSGSQIPTVSQAAWVRSLMATYVKAWEGHRTQIGGLFGAPLRRDEPVLPWNRRQQAAFLILVWQKLQVAVEGYKGNWAESLRAGSVQRLDLDSAFAGEHSLLATDQGVRGVLYVTNDLCFVMADELDLVTWSAVSIDEDMNEADVTAALDTAQAQPFFRFLDDVAMQLSSFDWRTSSAEGLNQDQRQMQGAFRGSSGYRLLRERLVMHLQLADGDVGIAAHRVRTRLRYK